jgi:hypothetical protein
VLHTTATKDHAYLHILHDGLLHLAREGLDPWPSRRLYEITANDLVLHTLAAKDPTYLHILHDGRGRRQPHEDLLHLPREGLDPWPLRQLCHPGTATVDGMGLGAHEGRIF